MSHWTNLNALSKGGLLCANKLNDTSKQTGIHGKLDVNLHNDYCGDVLGF